ncbi:hypothetical protein RF11_12422 [Thelohanellus kitauei]|uniref:Tc1-like transposase DDE domain-containing protein n=1 Tax=Thelohanellus kitauei TaxID=669202 RepID=A0A0C2N7K6_THEKT|nr:hypothetical protein RF11_12422 [Thelohanellus kitauei]
MTFKIDHILSFVKFGCHLQTCKASSHSEKTLGNIEARLVYVQPYFEGIPFSTTDIIYMDEAEFNVHKPRSYGPSLKRACTHIVVANFKRTNMSTCAEMKLSGIVNYRSIVVSYNKGEFCEFPRKCMVNLFNTPKIFVMDNIRFHHSTKVREVLDP